MGWGLLAIVMVANGSGSVTAGAAGVAGEADPLAPAGERGPELTLSVDGASDYVIVIPADASAPTTLAAEQLQNWLEKMTGAKLPITTDDKPSQAREISVGRTRRLQQADLEAASIDLKEDGYAIAAAGEKLYLLGGSRGPAMAVFALLEEDLGCRWYWLDFTHVPHRPTLRFRPVLRHYIPQFRHREATGYSHDRRMHTWTYRNRVSPFPQSLPERMGGSFDFAGPSSVHTFGRFFTKAYFKEHPAYYAENAEGERTTRGLCLTEPAVAKIMTEKVLEVLAAHPNSEVISVSQNDGPHYCRCDECTALAQKEGSRSGPIIHFVNQIAAEVQKHHPDVLVETLAYVYSVDPPKHVKPRSNVGVRLATDRNTWQFPFLDISQTSSTYDALIGWSEICDHILIWDYQANFSYGLLPTPQLPLFKPNLQIMADHGVMAYFVQGPGPDRKAMKSWVLAKLMWDPSRDARALQREFIRDYYGEAAPAIQQYNDMLWDMTVDANYQALAGRQVVLRNGFMKLKELAVVPAEMDPDAVAEQRWVSRLAAREGHPDIPLLATYDTRFPATARFFTPRFLARAKALLDQAESLADNEQVLRRVHADRVTILYLELNQLYSQLLKQGSVPDKQYYLDQLNRIEQLAKSVWGEDSRLWNRGVMEGQSLSEMVTQMREAFGEAPPAQMHRVKTGGGETVRLYQLGSEWRFRGDPRNVGVQENWQAVDVDLDAWGYVRTHSKGGLEKQGYPSFSGFGWYRKQIDVPEELQAPHLYVYFGAVDEDAWVYIDGRQVIDSAELTGLTPDDLWHTPFSREVADHINPGRKHVLTVRFIDRAGMAGIWRPVFLVASDQPLNTETITELVSKLQEQQEQSN